MIVEVDTDSPVPAYEQLRQQVTLMITSSTLSPGDRLPTIRQLAHDLELAPGTVARAYGELERDGLVVARGRRGTVVTAPNRWHEHLQHDARERRLEEAARAYVATARQLGISPRQAVRRVEQHFEASPAPTE